MDDLIRSRCITVAAYLIARQATVRQAARVFGLSKSSVHKDMVQRLPALDPDLADQVAALMRHNKAVCHLRGGDATRRRYAEERRRRALQTQAGCGILSSSNHHCSEALTHDVPNHQA